MSHVGQAMELPKSHRHPLAYQSSSPRAPAAREVGIMCHVPFRVEEHDLRLVGGSTMRISCV